MRSVSVVFPLSMCAEMPMFLASGSVPSAFNAGAARRARVEEKNRAEDAIGRVHSSPIVGGAAPTRAGPSIARVSADAATLPRGVIAAAHRAAIDAARRARPDIETGARGACVRRGLRVSPGG
jgi:hypothetical protein